MTEDDTFNALKRKPIIELYREWLDTWSVGLPIKSSFEYVIDNGYTKEEYFAHIDYARGKSHE